MCKLKLNLKPEMQRIIEEANFKIDEIENEDISDELAKLVSDAFSKEIIQKYKLESEDLEFMLDYIDNIEPEYFLIGLLEKNIDTIKYKKSLELLKIRISNSYIPEQRRQKIEKRSSVATVVSAVTAILSITISIASFINSSSNPTSPSQNIAYSHQ